MRRRKKRRGKRRKNPMLVVLRENPSRGKARNEKKARKSWGDFHLVDGKHAEMIEIDDIKGVPETVVVLGASEGLELSQRRTSKDHATVSFKRDPKGGPWLVCSMDKKTLWIIAAKAGDLDDLKQFNGWFVKATYYFPANKKSGKHHPKLAYRHAHGEEFAGDTNEHLWPRSWPTLKLVGKRCAMLVNPPRHGYRVTPDGIVR